MPHSTPDAAKQPYGWGKHEHMRRKHPAGRELYRHNGLEVERRDM
jgi:hypothetical protein